MVESLWFVERTEGEWVVEKIFVLLGTRNVATHSETRQDFFVYLFGSRKDRRWVGTTSKAEHRRRRIPAVISISDHLVDNATEHGASMQPPLQRLARLALNRKPFCVTFPSRCRIGSLELFHSFHCRTTLPYSAQTLAQ